MAIIPRPTKTGGEQTYTLEIANHNNTNILAAEVDDDFDTLYNDYNGNITNANIASAAAIATSKIAQDAGLQTGHYADGSVTTDKIADDAVDADKLADDPSIDANRAVTTDHIRDGAVTIDKLAAGLIQHSEVDTIASGNFTTEVEVAALASFTPNSTDSLMQLLVNVTGHISFAAASSSAAITIRLKRNGTQIASRGFSLPAWPAGAAVTTIIPWAASLAFHDTAQTVAVVYSVTLEASTTGTATVSRSGGDLSVIEHR